MTLTPNARVAFEVIANNIASGNLLSGPLPAKMSADLTLNNGTSNGQIDLILSRAVSGIAASTTVVYDLAGGENDAEGNAMTFAEVCLIAVKNTRTTAGAYVEYGPDTTNGVAISATCPWKAQTDRRRVAHNSGWDIWYSPDGFAITGGSADEIAFDTSATAGDTNEWQLIILGRSA